MILTGLIDWLRQSAEYAAWLNALRAAHTTQTVPVLRSARPFLLAALAQDWDAPLVYITARGRRAYNLTEQLPVWLGSDERVYRFAEPTPAFYDRLPWDRAVIRERLQTLAALQASDHAAQPPIVVTSARALMQKTIPPADLRAHTLRLTRGLRLAPDKLIAHLVSVGYEAASICAEPGTFTRRGGIVDVYPIHLNAPVRVDYFDDEIDTLKVFDPTTQRTRQPVESVSIVPAREGLPVHLRSVAHHLRELLRDQADDDDQISHQADLDALEQGMAFPHLEHYLPFIGRGSASLLNHVPLGSLILLDDADDIEARVDELVEAAETNRANNIATRQLAAAHPQPYLTWEALADALAAHRQVQLVGSGEDQTFGRLFAPESLYSGQLRALLTAVQSNARAENRYVIVSSQIDRITALWAELTGQSHVGRRTGIAALPDPVNFVAGELSGGWALHLADTTLHLISDSEIFNWQRPEPRRRKNEAVRRKQLPETDYADWKEGEYIVHVDFGIGQFMGLQSRETANGRREYLVLLYDDNAVVFVPVDQADRLNRYVGSDDKHPTLSNISRPLEWTRAKDKARRAAEEEARELLTIYAKRASVQGHAYRPDTVYQSEMEANFPYIETEDQLRVIREVKADMESPIPMDRLVTGDVGYGKTEVAIRAAFKAVMDGKQVAVLVPTTVLADQHYQTFARRMDGFGVVVELMSRFRTKGEQEAIARRLEQGKVDIIIGTHRLLSEDVHIPNLGLVIIDEEQRFGVKHKEHFKKFRASVDVLTLTATPIPRTLYMSLSGVRDISIIQTPPEERLPVITHVGPFNNRLARQAILRELDRGGQVFIIHNRVRTIEALRERFEMLVPEASIVVGHGQMSGRELERVINDFSRGQYDILMATSIIENGIDMPNVNTLIVDRSDWFGLAQLYQIRGRVGRGAQQAYAYFFHPKTGLTEEARERLQTLSEYTDLGVGLQIASRDLEMRGAGDILSMRQSGHITTVGLQLYSQLLQQAVSRLKAEHHGEAPQPPPTYERDRIIIELPVAAYIPEGWIPEMALRLQLYRRIGSLQNRADVADIRAELQDRFGKLPYAVEGLLFQMEVKLLAAEINATAVVKPRERIEIRLPWLHAVDRARLGRLLGLDVNVTRTAVELKVNAETWRERLLEILERIRLGMPEGVGV
ncbi:transcription-repair coupling factor [Aggregatilineales bacterium SYSU G02658]